MNGADQTAKGVGAALAKANAEPDKGVRTDLGRYSADKAYQKLKTLTTGIRQNNVQVKAPRKAPFRSVERAVFGSRSVQNHYKSAICGCELVGLKIRGSDVVGKNADGRLTCLAQTLRPPASQIAMPHLSRDQRLVLLGLRPEGGEQKAQGMSWNGESDLPVRRVARKITNAQKRGHEIGSLS